MTLFVWPPIITNYILDKSMQSILQLDTLCPAYEVENPPVDHEVVNKELMCGDYLGLKIKCIHSWRFLRILDYDSDGSFSMLNMVIHFTVTPNM